MRQAAVMQPAQKRSAPGSRPVVRGAWIAVIVVALLTAIAGTGLVVRRFTGAGAPISGAATLGGLSARLHDSGWLSMDDAHHDDQGGYQMPAQMMPGAPAGDDRRIGVPLTLVNTGDRVRRFNLAEEFFLRGGRENGPRTLHSDTFGPLSRLGPGSAVDGVLYFDTVVPGPDDQPLYLEWRRDGQTVPLAITMLGQAPAPHEHG